MSWPVGQLCDMIRYKGNQRAKRAQGATGSLHSLTDNLQCHAQAMPCKMWGPCRKNRLSLPRQQMRIALRENTR